MFNRNPGSSKKRATNPQETAEMKKAARRREESGECLVKSPVDDEDPSEQTKPPQVAGAPVEMISMERLRRIDGPVMRSSLAFEGVEGV